ncbi:hypothetical protein VR46_07600 [Streptomyces sp. NRRL S-444]|nr:hypothetical protein VR46_07600 [Streptomyces sp. NRRL S-444]
MLPKRFTISDGLTPASAAMPRIVTSAYGRSVNARRAARTMASRPVSALASPPASPPVSAPASAPALADAVVRESSVLFMRSPGRRSRTLTP